MNIALLLTSFLAGILTVLAPCVLPLLPVIVGGSLIDKNKWRPIVISFSLAASVVMFTLLLKVFTLFIMVPQEFWLYLSGGIILIFGIFLLIPEIWDWISVKLKFSQSSEGALQKVQGQKQSLWSAMLLGAALGPVFSSCSPTYFVILATVLPVSFATGMLYLLVYGLGLAIILILIAYLGRAVTTKLRFVANPRGWFKRGLGLLLILVGLAIVTGFDKYVELKLQEAGYGVTSIERDLLDGSGINKLQALPTTTTADAVAQTGTNATSKTAANLPNYGKAPELVGLQNWINSDALTLAGLRGKVVLIDFWTYSCINCIRTLPYMETWHEKYADKGLVIIGVHAPEFQFEKDLNNVKQAVKDQGLKYPVVQDNDFNTWRAYNNQYWPAKYLIDQNGDIRYYHFGEGNYDETEMAINELLGMNGKDLAADKVVAETGLNSAKLSPETYLGLARRARMQSDAEAKLTLNNWTLNGQWKSVDEMVTSGAAGDSHSLDFYASTANLVIGGKGTAKVYVDGNLLMENAGADVKDGVLNIDGERLYRLTNFGKDYAEHVIKIVFDEPGIDLYAWTFG